MPPGTVGPPFDQFLATAEAVAQERPEVDLQMAREVFHEAATLLHNGLVLDGLDGHDASAVVAGLCGDPAALRVAGTVKLEYLEHTGTFKAHGAFNRIISSSEDGSLDPGIGAVVASGGNAGPANAFATRTLGVPATVFVPESAPRVKVPKLRRFGSEVVLAGIEYATAHKAAIEHAATTGAVHCHAYDQPAVAPGAGTLGVEILKTWRRASTPSSWPWEVEG